MDITVNSIENLGEVVEVLTRYIDDGYNIFLLFGDLGSGKTTFTKAFCNSLDVIDPVTSPTFSLVNEYLSPLAGVIYHMDLYRLEKQEELAQIGFEEYLHSGCVCLIEWPEIGGPYFNMPHVLIKIDVAVNNIRIFNITTYDAVDA